jgi:hypothetical protein
MSNGQAEMNKTLGDLSLWGVVASNVFSIFIALIQGWNLGEVMWIFWAQSVIIGLINFVRILNLKEFSTENFQMNDRSVAPTEETKRQTAFFFLFHYGFFHFIYSIFLWQEMPLSSANLPHLLFLLVCALGFAGAHGFSFVHNLNRDFKDKKPNIGSLMFYPYMRIVPMHLTIIFGSALTMSGAGRLALLLFMVLKTFADAGMHVAEHRLFQKPDPQPFDLKSKIS